MAQMVEHLLHKWNVQSKTPSAAKKKKKPEETSQLKIVNCQDEGATW
jgi:hypothetical protein